MFDRKPAKEPVIGPHTFTPEKISEHPPGLYTQDGKLILQSPSADIIAKLQQAEPRVTYFHFMHSEFVPENGDILPFYKYTAVTESHTTYPVNAGKLTRSYDLISANGPPVEIFLRDSVEPLTQYLQQKYADQHIAIRGTACAISRRPLEIGGELITNPAQIASTGAERAADLAPQIGFDPKRELASRSVEWLFQHPQDLRDYAINHGQAEAAGYIFPVLIIYDRDQFEPDNFKLPQDPVKRHQTIKEVVVLDYPLSRQEFIAQSEAKT